MLPEPAPPPSPGSRPLPRHTLNVGDAPDGHSYLAIVERLAQECAVSAAAIVLVETGRLWFRASVGLGVREMPRGTPLGDLVAGEGLTVVEDAADDHRFAAAPLLLRDRPMRFYAGVPLTMHGGRRVGALCMLDAAPRRFTLADARPLRWLATRAMILMNVQKAVEQVAFGRAGS